MKSEKKRGRPRNEAALERILAAARALMDEGGIAAVTMEELASRTGVGKPTIYRSWPNAKAVAMAALIEHEPIAPRNKPSASIAVDLRREVRRIVAAFASRAGRNAAALIASSDPDTEIAKAFRHHVIMNSRERLREIVNRGMASGDLRPGADIEVALDLVLAPVFFRLLLGHGPLDESFADAVVKQALEGLRT